VNEGTIIFVLVLVHENITGYQVSKLYISESGIKITLSPLSCIHSEPWNLSKKQSMIPHSELKCWTNLGCAQGRRQGGWGLKPPRNVGWGPHDRGVYRGIEGSVVRWVAFGWFLRRSTLWSGKKCEKLLKKKGSQNFWERIGGGPRTTPAPPKLISPYTLGCATNNRNRPSV
jgi:hypothetical protein